MSDLCGSFGLSVRTMTSCTPGIPAANAIPLNQVGNNMTKPGHDGYSMLKDASRQLKLCAALD